MNATLPAAVRTLVGEADLVCGDGRAPDPAAVSALPPGARVALVGNGIGSHTRLRRTATRLRLDVEREYVVLPGWSTAVFVAEDAGSVLGWLAGHLATVPPRVTRGALAVDVALRAARRGGLPHALGWAAPARLLIARRR
jgi:hypothetical protein